MGQILDELGIEMAGQMADLPAASKSIGAPAAAKGQPQAVAAGGVSDADADLEARLDNLRRQ